MRGAVISALLVIHGCGAARETAPDQSSQAFLPPEIPSCVPRPQDILVANGSDHHEVAVEAGYAQGDCAELPAALFTVDVTNVGDAAWHVWIGDEGTRGSAELYVWGWVPARTRYEQGHWETTTTTSHASSGEFLVDAHTPAGGGYSSFRIAARVGAGKPFALHVSP